MSKKNSSSSDLNMPLFQNLNEFDIQKVETVSDAAANSVEFETLDFAIAERPSTCLEVDFPILKVNEISAIEAEPPCTKPIYKMSKWWARRRSSVFRQILLSAASKAPQDAKNSAQTSWALMYRKSHRRHKKYADLTVLDPFMGGGTTVVEASRLGFQTTGVDLNPMAWWIVKNETTRVKPEEVSAGYRLVEEKAKAQIMPFFTARSPRGFNGQWVKASDLSPVSIDPYKVPLNERILYKWIGPELIYTFWLKHIMCSDPACCHLTPQVSTAVMAEKSAAVKYFSDCVCPNCGSAFELELGDFRMAPDAKLILSPEVSPFAALDLNGVASCPECKHSLDQNWISQQKKRKGKPKSKEVTHYLLLDKKWLKGIQSPTKDAFGGYAGATAEQDEKWLKERSKGLSLIEIRGRPTADYDFTSFGTRSKVNSDDAEQASKELLCGKCGRAQSPLDSIKISGHQARLFPALIHGFDPRAKEQKISYGGRFFALPDIDQIIYAISEFSTRIDLKKWVPTSEIPFGHETHQRQLLPQHGYTHWHKMFNPRQLYANALVLDSIIETKELSTEVRSLLLGGWQNFLRHNCLFTLWHKGADQISPLFSSNNYHPKAIAIENYAFGTIGVGNFRAFSDNVVEAMSFAAAPYDLRVSASGEKGKTTKVTSDDTIQSEGVRLFCRSSTDLKGVLEDNSIDLCVTDPPFGDNLNYAELADFFLAWLGKPLQILFPELPVQTESPKSLEAVTNKARHPGENPEGIKAADQMYDRLLTLCWKEVFRVLKPGGVLAFTFHHDKDEAWMGVLESLFKAGFSLEATYPVRSDAKKKDGHMGAQKIEFDIIHVCRKRIREPVQVYWGTLRRKIIDSIKAKAGILASHRASGLDAADLEVIIKGEVLEQYSNHYGKVLRNIDGDLLTLKQILVESSTLATSFLIERQTDRIPDGLDPETALLFTLFRDASSIESNAARKRLKGSGAQLEDFISNGWIQESRLGRDRVVSLVSVPERWASLSRKRSWTSDLDQAHFAINCCIGEKIYKDKPADWEKWIVENYKSLVPSVGPILKFIETNHFGSDFKQAIGIAHRTLERTLQRLKETDGAFRAATEQMSLFGAEEK